MEFKKEMAKDWSEAYFKFYKSKEELIYPSETLIRLLKGNYLTGKKINFHNKKILDVGFGNGNNLQFLCSICKNVFGVEIHQDICNFVSKKLSQKGFQADLRLGSNQKLPFKTNSFDFLISWNVIHYEGTRENIKKSIKEYSRVLKPKGRLIISTTGPHHKILLKSKKLGNHIYKIGRPGDFRRNQIHFFFDTKSYINLFFSKYFKKIKIGRIYDNLFTEKLDWWLITGVN